MKDVRSFLLNYITNEISSSIFIGNQQSTEKTPLNPRAKEATPLCLERAADHNVLP